MRRARRRLQPRAGQDRHRLRRAHGRRARSTAPRPGSTSCPSSTPTSSSRRWGRSSASSAPARCSRCSSIIAWRIWRTAQLARDPLGTLICVGVLSMFVFQVFENVGMTMGIMPITGIPLPFVSYGGSSTLTAFIAMGLVLNVHMRRFSLTRRRCAEPEAEIERQRRSSVAGRCSRSSTRTSPTCRSSTVAVGLGQRRLPAGRRPGGAAAPPVAGAGAWSLHEQRWLAELAAGLPLPVPAPVRIGAPGPGYPWPWSVVPWLPRRGDRAGRARRLGRRRRAARRSSSPPCTSRPRRRAGQPVPRRAPRRPGGASAPTGLDLLGRRRSIGRRSMDEWHRASAATPRGRAAGVAPRRSPPAQHRSSTTGGSRRSSTSGT